MKARKFIYPDGTAVGMSILAAPSLHPLPVQPNAKEEIPYQVMKAGDPNSRGLAPKSSVSIQQQQHSAELSSSGSYSCAWYLNLTATSSPHWLISGTDRNI